jgi:hypothetical protein
LSRKTTAFGNIEALNVVTTDRQWQMIAMAPLLEMALLHPLITLMLLMLLVLLKAAAAQCRICFKSCHWDKLR